MRPLTFLVSALSLAATLHAQTLTNIAHLRTLVDPASYAPTDTTTLFTVEGLVTTHASITGGSVNSLFYLQDDTAGIPVFWRGGKANAPLAGDRLRVTAPLTHFNGLLELAPNTNNAAHSVTRLSSGHPLPAPVSLQFGWATDVPLIESYEGSFVVVSNVVIDNTTPTFPSGQTVTLTNEFGETFPLFVNAQTDIGGQPKPAGTVTVLGVLSQFDNSSPYTSAYQIIPTRYADILTPTKAPTVRFTNVLTLIRQGDAPTNTFTEHALLPGERLFLTVQVTDPEDRSFTIQPVPGPDPAGQWTIPQSSGTNLAATFGFTATAADAGRRIPIGLEAANAVATNTATWTIYVPTAAEQQITVSEFLANPPTTNSAPHFNPLRRVEPPPSPNTDDEYVELANLGPADADLLNWSIADSVQERHRFYESFLLPAAGSAVVYGGPLNNYPPVLDVPATPVTGGTVGFGMNNSGGDSILVRNSDGNLICRVVYTDRNVSSSGSASRFPDLNGPFVPQTWVSDLPVTPGRQYDGRPFSEPAAPLNGVPGVTASLDPVAALLLSWTADPARSYTVWQQGALTETRSPRFYGLRFTNDLGRFTDNSITNALMRFYWISSP